MCSLNQIISAVRVAVWWNEWLSCIADHCYCCRYLNRMFHLAVVSSLIQVHLLPKCQTRSRWTRNNGLSCRTHLVSFPCRIDAPNLWGLVVSWAICCLVLMTLCQEEIESNYSCLRWKAKRKMYCCCLQFVLFCPDMESSRHRHHVLPRIAPCFLTGSLMWNRWSCHFRLCFSWSIACNVILAYCACAVSVV